MVRGGHQRVREALEDLDARLAGLEVGYSEENATAARGIVDELEGLFEGEPERVVALRNAVEELVDAEDSDMVAPAEEHADALRRQVEAEMDREE